MIYLPTTIVTQSTTSSLRNCVNNIIAIETNESILPATSFSRNEKGAELDSKDKDDRTPLSFAARKWHQAVVKLLLAKGAEAEGGNEIKVGGNRSIGE